MKKILRDVSSYYTEKLRQYGPSPRGVDWKNEESQLLRFEQLYKIIENTAIHFSINDLGCGYGKLYEFLKKKCASFDYAGYDLSEEMIADACRLYGNAGGPSFRMIREPGEMIPADYTVASGIFNVKQGYSDIEWQDYCLSVIRQMDRFSRLGYSFNCLTSYSDRELMRADLYYANPCFLFDFCKKELSRNVALLHDYYLYEFTILIRKSI